MFEAVLDGFGTFSTSGLTGEREVAFFELKGFENDLADFWNGLPCRLEEL